ncbi:hypothetical protein ACHAXT_009402 [Thalassiosira profunda]
MSSIVRYVDHTYRDFSRYIEDGGALIKHKKSTNNFPAKLHKLLSDESYSAVITWMPHGRAWKVLDKERLISSALPEYDIACKKYESFTRQLNGWGFKRLYQSGPDLGSYYHECFLRGIPRLTTLVRRLPPLQGKATPYPAGEPNFYRISEVYPLPPRIQLQSDPAAAAAAAEGEAPAAGQESELAGFASAVPALPAPNQQSELAPQKPKAGSTALPEVVLQQHGPQYATAPAAHGFGEAPAASSVPPYGDQRALAGMPSPYHHQPQHLQYPQPDRLLGGLSTPSATAYQYPTQMQQPYTPSYEQQYPSGSADRLGTPHPPHYAQTGYEYSGQPPGGSYAQYPAQGELPYQTPRYRYPPPPPPEYQRYPPQSAARTVERVPPQYQYADPNVYDRYNPSQRGDIPATEPPPRADRDTGRSAAREPPRGDDRSPTIEPIPYTPSREFDAEKKPDPPTR